MRKKKMIMNNKINIQSTLKILAKKFKKKLKNFLMFNKSTIILLVNKMGWVIAVILTVIKILKIDKNLI